MFRTIEFSDPEFAPQGCHFITVKSAALKMRADLMLYIPRQLQGITSWRHNVPLVTLLHGVYGSHWAWCFKGGAHVIAQKLIDAGEIEPMILVMPSDGLWGDGSGYLKHSGLDFEKWITQEVPHAAQLVIQNEIEGTIKLIEENQNNEIIDNSSAPIAPIFNAHFICGLSMGGWGALRLAARHPNKYNAAAAHSCMTELNQFGQLIQEPTNNWQSDPNQKSALSVFDAIQQAGKNMPPFRFDCGTNDFLIEANRHLHQQLTDKKIPHQYEEFEGEHNWANWSAQLGKSLRFFAQHKKDSS